MSRVRSATAGERVVDLLVLMGALGFVLGFGAAFLWLPR